MECGLATSRDRNYWRQRAVFHARFISQREEKAKTPFGEPSDAYVLGTLEGRKVAFLARHGRGHRMLPIRTEFPGQHLRHEEAGRGADRFRFRRGIAEGRAQATGLRDPGPVYRPHPPSRGHVFRQRHRGPRAFADPVCADNSPQAIDGACRKLGVTAKRGGTYVCMEGPQFSTKAESNVYRSWGMDVIGMTNLQEAKLAREAEICYATVAMVTDYDCWHRTTMR